MAMGEAQIACISAILSVCRITSYLQHDPLALIRAPLPLGDDQHRGLGAVTGVFYAEKALPIGPAVSRIAAGALVACGVLVLIVPGALPTIM